VQRARKAEDKEGRRKLILGVARELWGEGASFATFNMAEVAERAGLAKGTVYIYFATKEALLLALLQEDLAEWMAVVDARLDQGGAWTPRRVAQLLADTLDERPSLTHLLSLMSSILEHNVPEDATLAFKTFLRDRVAATGARLEKRLPFLREGEGARVLVLCHALVTGLQPMARPPATVERLLARPDLAVFRVDFAKEMSAAVWSMLLGFAEIAEGRRG
jgi:AcrR family transcriptional regulator